MPRYDLRCVACGHTWEVSRAMTAPNPGCPACGGTAEQLPSATSFVLKGAGWAKDNYSTRTNT